LHRDNLREIGPNELVPGHEKAMTVTQDCIFSTGYNIENGLKFILRVAKTKEGTNDVNAGLGRSEVTVRHWMQCSGNGFLIIYLIIASS
jgi:hypothetical protein